MSEQLQLRRGTAAQVASFTGALAEVVVDTTNNRLVAQDGATAGGFPAAKLSEVMTISGYGARVAAFGPPAQLTGSTATITAPGAYWLMTGGMAVTIGTLSDYGLIDIKEMSGTGGATVSATIDTVSGALPLGAFQNLVLQPNAAMTATTRRRSMRPSRRRRAMRPAPASSTFRRRRAASTTSAPAPLSAPRRTTARRPPRSSSPPPPRSASSSRDRRRAAMRRSASCRPAPPRPTS